MFSKRKMMQYTEAENEAQKDNEIRKICYRKLILLQKTTIELLLRYDYYYSIVRLLLQKITNIKKITTLNCATLIKTYPKAT